MFPNEIAWSDALTATTWFFIGGKKKNVIFK